MTEKIAKIKKISDVSKFYDRFMASDVKSKGKLKDEILYQLYKMPTADPKEIAPQILDPQDHSPNQIQQADLLYMPDDSGYKYGLTVVDTGSRKTDCEPMKDRTALDALTAIKAIYKRGILKMPDLSIEVDSGAEFKKEFKQFFESKNVFVRTAQAGRSRQQGLVENRNGLIGKTLLRRMTAEELLTHEKSIEWVHYLPKLIAFMNKDYYMKKIFLTAEEIMADNKTVVNKPEKETTDDKEKKVSRPRVNQNNIILEAGTEVRVQLDKPIVALTGKRAHGTFREGDIKWSMKTSEITRVQLIPNQPIMYKIDGYIPLYTRNQLQIVDSAKSNLPPSTVQYKHIVKEILEKKKINKIWKYLIWWEGETKDKATYEPVDIITEDVPTIAEAFEKKLKSSKK
jgi:hypothetical protein